MPTSQEKKARVLAVDPHAQRVGFALFDGSDLVEWGTKNFRHDLVPRRIRQQIIPIVVDMVERFEPDCLVLPNVAADSRRSRHVVEAAGVITAAALDRNVAVHAFMNHEICVAFADAKGRPAANKHAINKLIVARYPELTASLPRRRKPWQHEHYFTPLFNAVALYWTWRETGGT